MNDDQTPLLPRTIREWAAVIAACLIIVAFLYLAALLAAGGQ